VSRTDTARAPTSHSWDTRDILASPLNKKQRKEGRKRERERKRQREVERRPGYKVTRNSGTLFTVWIIDERGVKYERRRAVINAGAELVRSFDSASRIKCAGLLAPRLASEQMARHRRHRVYCVTYVTSLCRNRSFSCSTRARRRSETLGRACISTLFSLSLFPKDNTMFIYLVKFGESRSVYVEVEYYCINHDNIVDRVLKDALQCWEIISISLRLNFFTDFDVYAHWENLLCIIHNWSYKMGVIK